MVDLVKLSQHYINNLHIVLFVAAKIIDIGDSVNTKDHWVALADKIKVNNEEINIASPLDGVIDFNFFTWGTIRSFKYRTILKYFLAHLYGGLAFQPIR
ncbi:hypothetical protein HYE59_06535 [Aggregatibacter actinomycetemcomitans]|uniref:hypothetical protein n=1 Tax=Aggregatibacter actinomycetemcomitans TaxID=714 RepID=UPI00197BDC27|nr:hypothetical protein [Aggregatibacter actinomycetemcomitans]MBN6077195.1 hypothetical protein [Aggregatibacter actinomycetemcomitans]